MIVTSTKRIAWLILLGMILFGFVIPQVQAQIQNPEEIEWTQFPLRSQWQKEQGMFGGEGMQMVMDIDWSEHDPNIVYLGVDTTRVWKSTDRGFTWTPIGKDIQPNGILAIKSDPNNVDVVFAFSMSIIGKEKEVDGIYRSIDGGISWKKALQRYGFSDKHISNLFLIDPESYDGFSSQVVYCGTPDGLFRSIDGGEKWHQVGLSGVEVVDIEWSKSDRRYIYIATNQGFYRLDTSTDLIEEIQAGLEVFDIAIDPSDPRIIYVVDKTSVYKSYDSGQSFQQINDGVLSRHNAYHIDINPNDPDHLLMSPHKRGGQLPYFSINGGASWSKPSNIKYSIEFLTAGYYFSKPIAFDPENPDVVLTHTGGSMAKSFNMGQDWHYSGEGYTGARVNQIRFFNDDERIVCMTDYGIFKTVDGGESFQDLNVERTNGAQSCQTFDAEGDTIIAAIGRWTSKDVLMSPDNGETWKNVLDLDSNIMFIEISGETVYADHWISHDLGENWQMINEDFSVRAVAGNKIFGIKPHGQKHTIVSYSDDQGMTWNALGDPQDFGKKITEFAVDPIDDMHILVAANKGLFEFKDGKWRFIDEDINHEPIYSDSDEFRSVKFNPSQPNEVWAVKRNWNGIHADGLYLSLDGGASWHNVINNLGPYESFYNIEVCPFDETVYVTGQGLWTFTPPPSPPGPPAVVDPPVVGPPSPPGPPAAVDPPVVGPPSPPGPTVVVDVGSPSPPVVKVFGKKAVH